ncbi:MAG: PBSX family phage terminase large subunit [Ruminococcus sp.]|nr:PBSX family phage terminase large subunit [Ruminococcus sp.]
MIYKKFSNRQTELMFWWCRPDTRNFDAIICDGAVRSGKTMSMTIGFVLWSVENFSNSDFALCGRTVESLKRNIIEPMKTWLEGIVTIRQRRNFLEIPAKNGVNRYYFFGGHDNSSYKIIQGATFAGVMLDEVTLMPESFVNQAIARCSISGSRIWFNCNPDSPTHWFYKSWILQANEKNALCLKFSMNDNPALDEDIKKRYKRLYSGIFYERYIMGRWSVAEGLVYDMFDKKINIIHKTPETVGDYYVSSDYGIQNATVFLLWRKEKSLKRWLCLDEWYYSGRENRRQKTVSELVREFKAWLGDIEPATIYIDPSATALITECRHNGFTVKPAKNDVLEGIVKVSSMLASGELIFSDKCTHTIEEFAGYSWDTSRPETDTPLKINDHCMDAVRYFANSRPKYAYITRFA